MKKIVVKLDLHDDRCKQKAMKAVSKLSGIDSMAVDMEKQQLTVIGDVDPVDIVSKLKKHSHTDIVSVGPSKDEKKEEKKPEEKIIDWAKAYNLYWPHNYAQPIYTAEENPYACVIL